MDIDDKEYNEFKKWKVHHKYSDTNEYPKSISWPKIYFNYNAALTKGQRSRKSINAFVKRFRKKGKEHIQLQFWYGKTLYLFDVLDATESQEKYQREKNIVDSYT